MILMAIANFGLMTAQGESVSEAEMQLESIGIYSELRVFNQDRLRVDSLTDQTNIVEYISERALDELYERSEGGLYRFSVTPRWLPGSLTQASPEQILNLRLKSSIERYTVFEVAYLHRNRRQTVEIQLSVDIEREIPVASRRIMNGDVIEEGDFELRWISVPHDRGQLVSSENELIGKTIRRTLVPGQPVRHADVSSNLLIEAGDEVQLIFENNGIQIQISVEARQSGAQDEEISLYSHETRRRYQGVISGPGVAKWIRTI